MAAMQMPIKYSIDFLRQTAVIHAADIFDGHSYTLKLVQATSAPSNVTDIPCLAEQYEY